MLHDRAGALQSGVPARPHHYFQHGQHHHDRQCQGDQQILGLMPEPGGMWCGLIFEEAEIHVRSGLAFGTTAPVLNQQALYLVENILRHHGAAHPGQDSFRQMLPVGRGVGRNLMNLQPALLHDLH